MKKFFYYSFFFLFNNLNASVEENIIDKLKKLKIFHSNSNKILTVKLRMEIVLLNILKKFTVNTIKETKKF